MRGYIRNFLHSLALDLGVDRKQVLSFGIAAFLTALCAPSLLAQKIIAIVAIGICGVTFIWNMDDFSGGFKLLRAVVFGCGFSILATSIVTIFFLVPR